MLQTIPPEVIASWPKPNYVNPQTRGPVVYIINGIFFSLATLTVGVRLYTRIFVRRWFGLDDFFIILAYVRVSLYSWNLKIHRKTKPLPNPNPLY
jgi:hypothetical protein